MIGSTISHYKILEKLRQTNGGQVSEVRLVPQSGTDETSAQFTFTWKVTA